MPALTNELLETLGLYTESVDLLLKAIADDDRSAFISAIAVLGMRRTALDVAVSSTLEVAA